jgi:Concanavalin A-like lectin/glucanases superfamily/Dual-action HEIGH metallo-peptidase
MGTRYSLFENHKLLLGVVFLFSGFVFVGQTYAATYFNFTDDSTQITNPSTYGTAFKLGHPSHSQPTSQSYFYKIHVVSTSCSGDFVVGFNGYNSSIYGDNVVSTVVLGGTNATGTSPSFAFGSNYNYSIAFYCGSGTSHASTILGSLGSFASENWNGSPGEVYSGTPYFCIGDTEADCESTPLSLISLQQYQSDATTTIASGGITAEDRVVLGATLNSSGLSTLQLQVEVKPTGFAFTGTPNVTSPFVSPGNQATTTYVGSNSSYHWQARVVDVNGSSSNWQAFGTSGVSTVDFIINHTPNSEESVHFDGSSAWAWPASNITLDDTNPLTIEFWYKTTSTASTFIDARSTSTGQGFALSKDSNGINLALSCGASSTIQFEAADKLANLDAIGYWHHVAISKGTAVLSPFLLYFDGAQQMSANCFDSSTTKTIWFGKSAISSTGYLTGDMDEVRIWNVQRSVSDIASSAQEEISPTSTGLLAYWTFNGTSTELVSGNATSAQVNNPVFSSSSPMGPHFIDFDSPPSVHNGNIFWIASTTYVSELTVAVNTWNAQGHIGVASATMARPADLLVSDTSTADVVWDGGWCASSLPGCPATDTIYLNQYYLNTHPNSSIQRTITHEFGHALGLNHSVFGNIMFYLGAGTSEASTTLGSQDKSDYNYLWGN